VKIEKLSSNKVKFIFDVKVEEFNHALDHAFEHEKENVEVKGFRKGHITRSVYENKFGVESLYNEAINHVFHHKFNEAIENSDYQLVGDPKPIIDFKDIKVGKEFQIAFEIAVKPEVNLGNYKGIEVEKFDDNIADNEIDAKINELAEKESFLEVKEEGELLNGDTAVFDFEGFVDGVAFEGGKAENFELKIGSGQFIPGFEDQMVSMKSGEKKDINVVFPEKYQAENLAGKNAVFKIKLHEIKTKVLPEINDDWVKGLNRNEKTLTALKDAIKNDLLETRKNDHKNKSLELALKKIAENSTVDIPVEMIDYEVKQAITNIEKQAKQYNMTFEQYVSITGMEEEELKKQIRKDSEVRVLNSLLIEAVGKQEKFEINSQDIEKSYNEIATNYKMDVAEVKKALSEKNIRSEIEFKLALDFIFDNLKFI